MSPTPNVTCVLPKRGNLNRDRHTHSQDDVKRHEGASRDDRGKDETDAAASQETPGTSGHHQKPGQDRKGPLQSPQESAAPMTP